MNPIRRESLHDLVDAYMSDLRDQRVEFERFRRFSCEEVMARDEANLDFLWPKNDSLGVVDTPSHLRSSRLRSSNNWRSGEPGWV